MTPVLLNDLMYERGRGPELRSCRITVYDLIPYLEHERYSDAQMLELWPITAAELDALKQYIADHRDEVMAVNRRIDERIAREMAAQQTPEFLARSEESRKRLFAFRDFLAERKENPDLFRECTNESPDDRRCRLFQTFEQWYAARVPAAHTEGR